MNSHIDLEGDKEIKDFLKEEEEAMDVEDEFELLDEGTRYKPPDIYKKTIEKPKLIDYSKDPTIDPSYYRISEKVINRSKARKEANDFFDKIGDPQEFDNIFDEKWIKNAGTLKTNEKLSLKPLDIEQYHICYSEFVARRLAIINLFSKKIEYNNYYNGSIAAVYCITCGKLRDAFPSWRKEIYYIKNDRCVYCMVKNPKAFAKMIEDKSIIIKKLEQKGTFDVYNYFIK